MKRITKLMVSFIQFVIFLQLIQLSIAQTKFQLVIGGTQYEYASSIVQATDSGYVLCGGHQQPTAYYDMYIVKLNSTGLLQWSRTIGEQNQEGGSAIIRTIDGSYVIAGSTASLGAGDYDMYIIKINTSGTVLWAKTIGGTSHDEAVSIVQTTDGGYAIAGSTNSFGAGVMDMYLVKLDASGSLQWSRTAGGSSTDETYSMVQTTDGGYVIVGQTGSFGASGTAIYVVKFDSSGTLQWSKTTGTTLGSFYAKTIIQTIGGGYVIAGSTLSFGAGASDMYLIKLDATGALQWSRTIGGTGNDYANSIIEIPDGSLVVAGQTYSFGTSGVYLVKLNASGILQWSRVLTHLPGDNALSIIRTVDGGYAVAGLSLGSSNGDMYVIKFDSSGNTCGNVTSPSSIIGTPSTILTSPATIVTSPSSILTTVSPTVSTSGAVTELCITYTISGQVRFQDNNQPVNSGIVKAVRYDSVSMQVVTIDSATIQSNGMYNLVNIPPGIHFDIMAFENDEYEQVFVPTYYPSTTSWQNAVTLLADSNLSNININVYRISSPAGPFFISGHVTRLTDNPLQGLNSAIVYAKTGNVYNAYSISNNLGAYRVDSLSSGTYTMVVDRMGFTDITRSVTLTNFSKDTIDFTLSNGPIGISTQNMEIPEVFWLGTNYPNPFNPNTKINFGLPRQSIVKLVIYDVLGREVAVLVNEELKAGNYSVYWNASSAASGIYFYRIEANDFLLTKKMVLIK